MSSGKKLNILAIGSHPDDIEFGCGGTIRHFVTKGHHCFMLVLTRGEVGGDENIRSKEQDDAARVLGVEKVFWGGFQDTKIPVSKEAIISVEEIIKTTAADVIFVNYPDDTHQDHRATAQCVNSASRYVKNVLYFECPTTQNFNPDVFTDITGTLDTKLQALKAHGSQVNRVNIADLSILDCAISTAIFRGVQARVKYAEGFKASRMFMDCLF